IEVVERAADAAAGQELGSRLGAAAPAPVLGIGIDGDVLQIDGTGSQELGKDDCTHLAALGAALGRQGYVALDPDGLIPVPAEHDASRSAVAPERLGR